MSARVAGREAGFTLIEVLVAFVILVAALPTLYGIFSGGLRSTALAEDYQRAVAFGESWLAQYGVTAPLRQAEGDRLALGPYTLIMTTRPHQPLADVDTGRLDLQAWEVSIDITWERFGRQRSVRLSTIKLAVPATGREV